MKTKLLTTLFLTAAMLAAACGKSDADLTKAATDKLTADKISGVSVTVSNGEATLSGEVADITVKNKAEAAVKSVEGIKTIKNNITLKPLPTATPSANDAALQGKIEENLKKAGCTGASVTVDNGAVTVDGTVPAAKYVECVQVIQQSGITGIKNNLKKG